MGYVLIFPLDYPLLKSKGGRRVEGYLEPKKPMTSVRMLRSERTPSPMMIGMRNGVSSGFPSWKPALTPKASPAPNPP